MNLKNAKDTNIYVSIKNNCGLKYLLIIFLILSFSYNVQISEVRLLIVIILLVSPLPFLFVVRIRRPALLLALGLFALYAINASSFLIRLLSSQTVLLSFSGPEAEMLAMLLSFSVLYSLALKVWIESYPTRASSITSLLLAVIAGIYLFDMVLRYNLNPQCFLNYGCRHAAKTIGLFSTTNVSGAVLATILTVLQATRTVRYNFIFASTMLVVLITTMARSAIIAYLAVTLIMYFFRANSRIRALITVCLILLATFVVAFNPANILNDGSLLSKFAFIESGLRIFRDANTLQVLFGFGTSYKEITELLGVQGWSPHLPTLKAFLYFGILGICLHLLVQLYLFTIAGRAFVWPLLLTTIYGLAGAPVYNFSLTGAALLTVLLNQKYNSRSIP